MSAIFGTTFSAFVVSPLLGGIALFSKIGSAAIKAGKDMISFAGDTLESAEALERMSQQTGASVELLTALEKRLEVAGFGADKAGQSFNFMNKFIADANQGGKIAVDLLDSMGVSLDGISSSDDRFRVLLDGLNSIEDQALRSDAAMLIFGRTAGIEVVNAIGGGNTAIDEMIQQYRDLGFVIDQQSVHAMANMNTSIGITNQAIEGFKGNLMRQFLAGMAGDADLSNEGIIELAATLNKELGPEVRRLGESIMSSLNEITPALSQIAPLVSEISEQIRLLDAAYEDSFLQLYLTGNRGLAQAGASGVASQFEFLDAISPYLARPTNQIFGALD